MLALAPTPAKRAADAGITLIEVLVVLAVIGVAAGATMLGVNASDRGSRAESEALRLARHLTLAVDEALISGRDHALAWDRTGYLFQSYEKRDGWGPAQLSVLAQRHDMRAGTTLSRLDETEAPIPVAASAVGPEIVMMIVGNTMSWVVVFDGFTAFAMSEASFRAGEKS